MVNAILIGAARSGTTSLAYYLERHKQVCFSSVKEVCYFSVKDLYRRGETFFHSFFTPQNNETVKVTSDTYLLIDKEAPTLIKNYNPAMKIIVILRHPVKRAYSSFYYAKNNGHDKSSIFFDDWLKNEADLIKNADIITKNNLGHFYAGLYYQHLKSWSEHFKPENMLILTTDSLKNNKEKVFARLCDFLEIEQQLPNENSHKNKASKPKNKSLHRFFIDRDMFLRKIIRNTVPQKLKNKVINSGIVEKMKRKNMEDTNYPPITEKQLNENCSFFEDDLQNLQKYFDITFN